MKIASVTLRELSDRWTRALREGRDPPHETIGDFLDDFRHRAGTPAERLRRVAAEPVWTEDERGAECNAYWAAMAETLCQEAGLPPPTWTESPRSFLHRPWFAGGLESLKATLIAESPAAFRRRNLFVSENALARA